MVFEETCNGLLYRVTIHSPLGLHARPAARLVQELQLFSTTITVYCGNNSADGKSILDLLTLGAVAGSELAFYAQGTDAHACLTHIAELFSRGFKE